MQQYNCQNGQSWYDVCLNTYGSLDYLGKLVSDNGGELNVQPTTNTVIYWDQSLVKDSSLLSLIKNNGYVYNTGVSLAGLTVSSYSFGESEITFEPDGSDAWNVTALLEPTSFTNIPDGLPVNSVGFNIDFWSGGSDTHIYDNIITTDETQNTGAHGAGVYFVSVIYQFSDGTAFAVFGYYLVDATDTVLQSVVFSGVQVSNVNGLTQDLDITVTETNCSFVYNIYGVKTDNSSYLLGTDLSATYTLQPLTQYIFIEPQFDASFTNDYDGDASVLQAIIIS